MTGLAPYVTIHVTVGVLAPLRAAYLRKPCRCTRCTDRPGRLRCGRDTRTIPLARAWRGLDRYFGQPRRRSAS